MIDEATKAAIVELLRGGSSNRRVALRMGVTVNVVAGIRRRTFGRTMSQAEALKLPKDQRGRNETVGPVLGFLAVMPGETSSSEIAAALGFARHRVYTTLRPLVAAGVVLRSGRSCRMTRYRLAGCRAR